MSTTTVGRAPAAGSAEARERTETAAVTGTDMALLVLRLALGAIFFAHGAQKVLGWWGGNGLEATVTGMAGMGIPAFLAYVAAFTEFFGGLALIVGVLSRLASLGLFITMLVAIFMVHGKNGFFSSNQGFEYNLALAAMALAIFLAGPGRIALGDFERRFLRRG